MSDDQFWMQGTAEYQHALSQATGIWGEKTDPQVLNAAAATILIHVCKLRDQAKRESWHSPQEGAKVSASASSGPIPAQPPAPPRADGNAPTDKQVAFFKKLISNGIFSESERQQGLQWLATEATRKSIQGQIDYLKGRVDATRGAPFAR